MKEEEYEAIPDIATLWEDPSSTYPRRSWPIIRAFCNALNTNISVWIHKLRKRGLSTLAAHGTSLMGCDGSYAKLREVRNEKLLLNREAWNAVDKMDKFECYIHLATVGHLTKTISDPRISSWNVGHPRVPRRERGNLYPVRDRRPHYLLARSEDPGEQSSCGEERTARPLPPLLDLHFHGDIQWGNKSR